MRRCLAAVAATPARCRRPRARHRPGQRVAGGGSGGDIIWLTVDPMAEVVLPDGGSVDVTLTFDSTGLTWGDYFGVLDILNAPDPKITIPVQLRVWDFERVYMPFTFTRYPHPAKQ